MRIAEMRRIDRIILSLAMVIGSCLFASPAYPGGSNGVWDQIHVAIFGESSGNVGTQIGGDDVAYTVEPGRKIFVVIQANFTTQSKDQKLQISWRQWGGTWAVASPKGTGSSTAWEYWESNYASLGAATIHFAGSLSAIYLEDSNTDGNDPTGLREFWFVVEAPTTQARYELAISEDGVVTGSQGTISQQCDITVAVPFTLADHAAGQQGNNFVGGSTITGAQLFGFKLLTRLSSSSPRSRGLRREILPTLQSTWMTTTTARSRRERPPQGAARAW
jgi:hypothetical protein